MINRQALLADLQKFLQRTEADLLERSESTEVPEVPAALHAEYEKAAKAERTAQNYEDWRTDTITQAAAAWVLSCVFVRFLEDNALIDPPKIAGPEDRLARARDEHELYFRSHPQYTDREYLLSIFGELAKLPGTKDIFGEHNAINDLPNWLSGDAAGELLNFFQKIDASTGELVHDFTDPSWDTRFLGDLYQDLSEAARKKFALLQTPDFVEEFILDRTLEPAIEEFGLAPQPSSSDQQIFKMIDPACGSGHFLLGAFPRLLDRWQRNEPATNIRELTQRALNSIHGVDINPYAVAIAKFRLLIAATKACGIIRITDSPAFHINVVCGDSLLHGENRTSTGQRLWDYAEGASEEDLFIHAYPGEDLQAVRLFLKPGSYHCVVANPPYIIPRDRKLNEWYRKRFTACHGKYSLAVPFMQQIFQLAFTGGYTGQITANSFMKREFGKKLVERFLSDVDLTHVVDSSVAYIPGHGTPTAIIFGRNRAPVAATLRTVMGITGEQTIPEDPSLGIVWNLITKLIDQPGATSEYLSVLDSPRESFRKHPWSIGGGGASELKELIDESSEKTLRDLCVAIGVNVAAGEDDAYFYENCRSSSLAKDDLLPIVSGESIRDWRVQHFSKIFAPYDSRFAVKEEQVLNNQIRTLWPYRTLLKQRKRFGVPMLQKGAKWFEWQELYKDKQSGQWSICIAEVATHNHFAITQSKVLFKNTAQVVKLKTDQSFESHLDILALLNSSLVCFYLKQVCFRKGGSKSTDGARLKTELWTNQMQFNSTNIARLPICDELPDKRFHRLHEIGEKLDKLSPQSVLSASENIWGDLAMEFRKAEVRFNSLLSESIYLQEELDWEVYNRYGLCSDSGGGVHKSDNIGLKVGERAFEIYLARQIAAAKTQTTWFERNGAVPISETPAHWSESYRQTVGNRIELIENNPNIRLIEQPEYKRRWNIESWQSQLDRALREFLLLRLETYFDFDRRMNDISNTKGTPVPLGEVSMCSVAQLADTARREPQFMKIGELYRNDPAFDVQALVEELVLAESVPHLPILCYKDSGLRKRAEWEKIWDLQRREDTGEPVGTIPVPPKYSSADFISAGEARYWSLRGKLDVPKERWISFPHCEGPDGTLVICWAGYDHLQQAQAISAYYVRVQTEFGGSDDSRLIPLLASLIELLPRLKQWHNEPNANFDGLRMGDYFEGFVNEEARNLGKTLAEIKAWVPPKKVAKKKGVSKSAMKKISKKATSQDTV